MNCLTNEELQLFIDNELQQSKKEEFNLHLQECKSCAQRLKEHKEFIALIISQINTDAPTVDVVPPFLGTEVKPVKRKRINVWLKVAAIILPLIVFYGIYSNRGETTENKRFTITAEDIMQYEAYNTNIDANTACQQGMVITTVIDQEKEEVETTIN